MAVIEEADKPNQPTPSSANRPQHVLPDELSYLITSFTPSNDQAKRSKAYLILASYCQGVRTSAVHAKSDVPDPGTRMLSRTFFPILQARLTEAKEVDILTGLSFFAALFQVDWQAASDIFQTEDTITAITEILDLYPSDLVSREAARLLSQACGHKACRAILPADVTQWLESAVRQNKDIPLRAAAAVAVTKLSRGAGSDALDGTAQNLVPPADHGLVDLLKGILLEGSQISVVDAVEGLAYMSVDPTIKESLSQDSAFLTKLFGFVPTRRKTSGPAPDAPSHSLVYGILNIIYNISAYRPPLSPEQEQLMTLRRMAKPAAGTSRGSDDSSSDALEDDQHVQERGRRLVKNGAVNVLVAAVRIADSQGVRIIAGRALLNLTTDKENRGRILQSGGARMLSDIIRKSFPSPTSSQPEQLEVDVTALDPIQALAKLAITSSPTQVFGPDTGAVYNSIRPFAALLTHSTSSLLQRFEAIMALTNISSQGVEAASRVATADGLLTKIEFLMLEDHALIRRAATELVCNLVAGSDSVFERYSDGNSAKSRLHVLVALSDVDDLPTRLAASGTLASLSSSPDVCRSLYELERDHQRIIDIFVMLIDPSSAEPEPGAPQPTAMPDPALVHRGVVCIRNLLVNLNPNLQKQLKEERGLDDLARGLLTVVKGNAANAAILRPTAEAVKCLMDLGVTISGT